MVIFKTTWKSYFKNNEKIPGNLLKNLEKSWKYHGILSVQKSGNPDYLSFSKIDILIHTNLIFLDISLKLSGKDRQLLHLVEFSELGTPVVADLGKL